MKEDQFENDVAVEVECHRFTPADMAGSLLHGGFTATEIEDKVAAAEGSVQQWLADEDIILDQSPSELLRLKQLYLREQVKAVFRNSPFIGVQKGSERIGITKKQFEFIYKALLSSGDLTY